MATLSSLEIRNTYVRVKAFEPGEDDGSQNLLDSHAGVQGEGGTDGGSEAADGVTIGDAA
jgi:hypothetical protein